MREIGRVIVFGYGNPWRQDDGVGPLLAERIADWLRERGVEAEAEIDHQLLPEAAERLAGRDLALFCDADLRDHPEGFRFERVFPEERPEGLNLHTLGVGWFLGLARTLGIDPPEARLISVSGESFDLTDTLTEACAERAERAFRAVARFFEGEAGEGSPA